MFAVISETCQILHLLFCLFGIILLLLLMIASGLPMLAENLCIWPAWLQKDTLISCRDISTIIWPPIWVYSIVSGIVWYKKRMCFFWEIKVPADYLVGMLCSDILTNFLMKSSDEWLNAHCPVGNCRELYCRELYCHGSVVCILSQ